MRAFEGVFTFPLLSMRDASGTRTVSKRAHEACHVTAIFKEMWRSGGSKAHFFLASQGRRLRPARPCASRPARPRFPDLTWFCYHIFEFRHKGSGTEQWRRDRGAGGRAGGALEQELTDLLLIFCPARVCGLRWGSARRQDARGWAMMARASTAWATGAAAGTEG